MSTSTNTGLSWFCSAGATVVGKPVQEDYFIGQALGGQVAQDQECAAQQDRGGQQGITRDDISNGR